MYPRMSLEVVKCPPVGNLMSQNLAGKQSRVPLELADCSGPPPSDFNRSGKHFPREESQRSFAMTDSDNDDTIGRNEHRSNRGRPHDQCSEAPSQSYHPPRDTAY